MALSAAAVQAELYALADTLRKATETGTAPSERLAALQALLDTNANLTKVLASGKVPALQELQQAAHGRLATVQQQYSALSACNQQLQVLYSLHT